VDDYLACSDLCEEKGFMRPAALLRTAAGEGGKVYLVVERGVEYNDEHNYLTEGYGTTPRALFLDRAEAEQAARLRTARRLRETPLEGFGLNTDDFTSLTRSELNRRVGAILGTRFSLWVGDHANPNPFPASATDEQMIEVATLFDKLQFYYVLEVEFGG
jgi:hypothetical protein